MDRSSTATAGGADGYGDEVAPHLDMTVPDLAMEEQSNRKDPIVAMLDEEPASDGRVARGQRTRRNVADALIALLRDTDTEPTARAVAQEAGVSLRLVFHHFADMDDLYHFVAALQFRSEWCALPQLSPDLDLPTRIERTAAQRAELFERIAPVRRAIARRTSSDGVKQTVAASDALLLERLEHTFAPELGELDPQERAEQLEAMDTMSSWEAWDRMRRTSRLGVDDARRVMARMLAACTGALADTAATPVPVGAGAAAV